MAGSQPDQDEVVVQHLSLVRPHAVIRFGPMLEHGKETDSRAIGGYPMGAAAMIAVAPFFIRLGRTRYRGQHFSCTMIRAGVAIFRWKGKEGESLTQQRKGAEGE